MVSIDFQPTAKTRVDPGGQRHLLPMSTAATVLTRVGRINSRYPSDLERKVGITMGIFTLRSAILHEMKEKEEEWLLSLEQFKENMDQLVERWWND